MIAEMRKRLAKHPGVPARASPPRNALGSGEGAGGFAISANILGPDLDAAVRLLAAGAGRGAADAEPGRAEAEPAASRTRRFTSRSIASAPPISACGCRRSATRCAWRSRATIRSRSTRKGRSSTRSRSACSRTSAATSQEIGRLTVPSPTGPVRIDNIARIERGLGPSALQRSNRQFTVHAERRRRAGPRARRGVERHPQADRRPQPAADDVATGCRGSRRSSTRPRPT